MSNPIIDENANKGTNGWVFSNPATTEIQAYANTSTLDPGQTITFYVSGATGGQAYTATIYRLGWYNGAGGRLIASLGSFTLVAQGYYDGTTLQSNPTAIIDNTTHLVDANWASSLTWTVPSNACTGIYVANFTNSVSGKQWGVSFVVRGNPTAEYVVTRPFTTDHAYNLWGGWSMYTATKAQKVSFNRPAGWGDAGLTNLYGYDMPTIRYLERQGYNMAYRCNLDMHTNGAELKSFKGFISMGHDEYWSKPMRDAVEAARDAGTGLAFVGANACYWQVRFEADANSNPNRTMVCYKVNTPVLSADPMYGVDNTVVTSNWRDPVINRPESTLCGIMYSNNNHTGNTAWTADPSPDTTYTYGTGLVPGQSYGSDMMGNEWDKIQTGSPANIKVIGTTAVVPGVGGNDTSNTTTYKANSGALVFASGSLCWGYALDHYRHFPTTSPREVQELQYLFANIMAAFKGPIYGNLGH